MPKLSFEGMVKDPFSLFNIILIFILMISFSYIIIYPVVDDLIYGTGSESDPGMNNKTSIERAFELKSPPEYVLIILAVQNIILVTLIYMRVIWLGKRSPRDMGISMDNIGRNVLIGLLLSAIIIVILAIITLALAQVKLEDEPMFQTPVNPSELAMVLIGVAVFAPIGEELFFRAYIVTALKARYHRYIAYSFSAVFFAIVHFNIAASIQILLVGLFLAVIFERYKNIVPCIIIHAMNNFIAVLIIYFFGYNI
jgi:membrane protease YdiL (CAAX protease family)